MSSQHSTLRGLYGSAVGYDIADPGNAGTILVDRQLGLVKLVSAAAETRTLPVPLFAGAIVTVQMKTDGGDVTLTVTGGFDEAANTTITFSATGQFVTFISVEEGSNLRWRVVGYDGVTGPTVALGTILADTINEVTAASGVTVDTAIIRDGMFHPIQGAPTAETGAATVTIADMLSGIVTITQSTGGDVALTVDTGTAMDTGKPASFGVGASIDWTVINLSAAAADTATVTAAAGHTLVGVMVVQSAHATTGGLYGNTARFRSRRTAANTWVTYRIG